MKQALVCKLQRHLVDYKEESWVQLAAIKLCQGSTKVPRHHEELLLTILWNDFWRSYSIIRNRRACTFISYEKNSPCTSIPSHVYGLILVCTFINFEKKFPLHGLILVCMYNVFQEFSRVFCKFISSYTSIWYTRVDMLYFMDLRIEKNARVPECDGWFTFDFKTTF